MTAQLIKTVLGGVIVKNMRLVVFLDPKEYMQTLETSKGLGISAKTDSQLLNKVCFAFNDIPFLRMKNDTLQIENRNKDCIIDQLRAEIADLKTKKKGLKKE